MDRLHMESVDITAQNIDKFAELFPNCVTEAADENGKLKRAINFKLLKQMLSSDVIDGAEAYEFTWVGKKAAIVEANKPIRKTLRPRPEESKNWDTTENLYIEGDNLDVLKLLRKSYFRKVKMIYIDPPYNTGNDFIYRDSFHMDTDKYEKGIEHFNEKGDRLFKNTDSNGCFHSDWCSMIYSRLMLARDLLTDDGVIFISIDDGELCALRNICDEVFGKNNFRNTILVRRRIKSLNSQFADNGLYSMNVGFEYVLVYSKNSTFLMKALRQSKENIEEKGRWDVFWSNADRPTMRYDILGFTPATGQWRNSKEKADIAVANYKKYEDEFKDKISLEEYSRQTGITDFIRRIPNGVGKNGGVQHWIAPSGTMLRTSNWTDIEVSQIGKEIDLSFDNPKSKKLIIELAKLAGCSQNDIILDFFSGSATTAHAVMQLNAEDNGHRKFIMVQLPEPCDKNSKAYKAGYKNVCEIGKERIRRAGEKIKAENPLTTQDLDVGFRVFKLDDTNMKDVYYVPNDYEQGMLAGLESNIKEDRTDLDLLFGCLLDWGLPLSMLYKSEKIDGYTVHTYNNGDLIACFDENIPESVIKKIAKCKSLRAVFRDSSFVNSPAKINVSEIFKLLAPDTRVRVI